jgi:hypothetical protein
MACSSLDYNIQRLCMYIVDQADKLASFVLSHFQSRSLDHVLCDRHVVQGMYKRGPLYFMYVSFGQGPWFRTYDLSMLVLTAS